ncbi:MAG: tetratricopeptide repeat protein [Proteobacteria bacterium]|nr:tetratricopeptide repeat protein [Pseudomonadota bacterium]
MLKKFLKFGLCVSIFFYMANNVLCNERPDESLFWYHKGISAKTHQERLDAFEKALELYMIQYNEMKNEGKTNAFLCYNIGNCYFNLKQTGQAIYYYEIALKLLPQNALISENLKTALEKRSGAIDVKHNEIKEILLFFHYKISTRDRIRIMIWLSVAAFLFYLPAIFRQHTLSRYLSIIMFSLFGCIALSICAESYFPQYEGVVVHPAYIRKDAGDAFTPIVPDPLGEGSIVRIITPENEWLKVEIGEGKRGYIRKDDLKVII